MTTVTQAGFNTLLGMGTVFIVLIPMSFIIRCFKLIPLIEEIISKKPEVEAEKTKESALPAEDTEIVAVIAAAVAAAEGVATDSFVVRNIKRRV